MIACLYLLALLQAVLYPVFRPMTAGIVFSLPPEPELVKQEKMDRRITATVVHR